jgi:hypothetical protein
MIPIGWLRFAPYATDARRHATSRTSRGPSGWHSISKTSSIACATRSLDGRCHRRANGGNWCTASKNLSVDALDAGEPPRPCSSRITTNLDNQKLGARRNRRLSANISSTVKLVGHPPVIGLASKRETLDANRRRFIDEIRRGRIRDGVSTSERPRGKVKSGRCPPNYFRRQARHGLWPATAPRPLRKRLGENGASSGGSSPPLIQSARYATKPGAIAKP